MTTAASSKPQVVHCKRSEFDVYIGRPSIWGNPFVIGKDGDRAEVVAKFRAWFMGQPDLMERAKVELKGKVLGCYCAPLKCHGDVLWEIANGGTEPAPRGRRLLVCGGRGFSDRARVDEVLTKYKEKYGIAVLIHGAARGADSLAADWAKLNCIATESYPADWDRYGKSAGYKRNTQMLVEGKPDDVIAFPGGTGTDMMCDIATKAQKKVYRIPGLP